MQCLYCVCAHLTTVALGECYQISACEHAASSSAERGARSWYVTRGKHTYSVRVVHNSSFIVFAAPLCEGYMMSFL
jgi:hypothetical protein